MVVVIPNSVIAGTIVPSTEGITLPIKLRTNVLFIALLSDIQHYSTVILFLILFIGIPEGLWLPKFHFARKGLPG